MLMASVSLERAVNASFSYLGQNASTKILSGQLDDAHQSTLSAYWINFPTPWPYLLISVAISLGLGWLGFRSSAKSWQPVHKRRGEHQLLPSSDIELSSTTENQPVPATEATVTPQFYTDKKNKGFFRGLVDREMRMKGMSKEQRRAFLMDQNHSLAADAERAANAENVTTGQTFDPEDDLKPDGGVGKFAMYRTIFGVAWTTIRALSIFILSINIAHNVNNPTKASSYPGPLSIMILFASAQTYLAGRGMPRLFNVISAYNLVLIWIAMLISSYGPGSTTKYYGKIGIQGGTCPFFDRGKYNDGHQCASGRWQTVGCSTNSTWDTSAHDYPRAAWWLTGNADPNTYGNSLLTFELDFKTIGLIYGLTAIFLALPFYFLPIGYRDIMKPLPATRVAILRRISYSTSLAAFLIVCVLSIIAVPIHISTELSPPRFPYIDCIGPIVNTSIFNSDSAEYAIDRQWPSLAWNQSHAPVSSGAPAGTQGAFLGGNETTWSDCFWVQAPADRAGHLKAWWDGGEGKVLRLLAGL